MFIIIKAKKYRNLYIRKEPTDEEKTNNRIEFYNLCNNVNFNNRNCICNSEKDS